MRIEQIVAEAMKIVEAHSIGAEMDAGFDGGEFSGPAHCEMEVDDLAELAKIHGLSYDQLDSFMMVEANKEMTLQEQAAWADSIENLYERF